MSQETTQCVSRLRLPVETVKQIAARLDPKSRNYNVDLYRRCVLEKLRQQVKGS